ncbi:MAG: glycosyltransferase family 39 protein [Kiritimatiellae bacterium]|nr:glycosyltransferase family 39 protein [Kiritimatiellia bacterium]
MTITRSARLQTLLARLRRRFPPRGQRAVWGLEAAGWFCGAAVVIVFAGFLLAYRARFVREVDTQGYYLMAQSFACGRLPVFEEDCFRYVRHVYVGVQGGRVAPKYAPGYPLCLALGYLVGGVRAVFWTNTVLSLLAGLGVWLLARELHGAVTGAVLSALFLFSPQFLAYTVYPLAHAASTAFVLLAFLFAAWWGRTGRAAWAGLACFAAVFAALVRPTNALMWPAVGLAVWGFRGAPGRERGGRLLTRRTLIAAGVCSLVPLGVWAAYNWRLFGCPWRTGYALTREQYAFRLGSIGERLRPLWAARTQLLDDPIWLLGVAGLFYGLARRWRQAVVLVAWFLPVSILYAGYYWFRPELTTAYSRFFLAALPGFLLGAGFLAADLRRRWWGRAVVLGLGCAGFALAPPSRFLELARRLDGPAWNRTADLLGDQFRQPTDLYGGGWLAWHGSVYPGVRTYPADAWRDGHLFGDYDPDRCQQLWPRIDLARHRAIHERYRKLGRAGVQRLLLDQIHGALTARRRVLIADLAGWPGPLHGCRRDRRFDAQPVRLPPDAGFVLWEITLRRPGKTE